MDVEVFVVLDGEDVLAGTLYSHRRRGTESATFTYAASYLAADGAYALDPALPLTSGAMQTRTGTPLFGCFTDCAPDRWGRTLLSRREAAVARSDGRTPRTLGEIDFLLGVRDDLRQGALRLRTGNGPFLSTGDTGVPALTDLPALLDLASRAENDRADEADLQRLVRAGSSLGGARPKAHVLDANRRVAIAKFPSTNQDTWNVMAWEKVSLDLAGHAGIDVPESTLHRIAGRSVLVVDRFDRTSRGGRIGYVSAMTMLEASDGEQRSYLDMAQILENVSRHATDDLHQLWRRVVFNVLISNTDDHLRNHGFCYEGGDSWRLSPAFDLNPNPATGPKYLSTTIDGTDGPASLSAALDVAEYFRLPESAAQATLREVAAAVSRWRDVAAQYRLTPREIGAMSPAFAALQ